MSDGLTPAQQQRLHQLREIARRQRQARTLTGELEKKERQQRKDGLSRDLDSFLQAIDDGTELELLARLDLAKPPTNTWLDDRIRTERDPGRRAALRMLRATEEDQ
ncbi:hypothetical protein [Streptomyces lasiicapitis]|uniref:hypothetical protein n=1 Tax=Streptomyces lasiicapitis TaxID=1923961 RepID=UPI0036826DC9